MPITSRAVWRVLRPISTISRNFPPAQGAVHSIFIDPGHGSLGLTRFSFRATFSTSCMAYAEPLGPNATASDPAEEEALHCLEQGTLKLEEGDVEAAKELYLRSTAIRKNASSLFNLGVAHYHLKEFDEAITAWKESIALQPSSPDAHTNLASAYIISPASRPDLALHHLQIASKLAPEDPEIAFNLATVLEATGHLEDALEQYKKSEKYGVEKAAMYIRNVSAKLLAKRMDGVSSNKPK